MSFLNFQLGSQLIKLHWLFVWYVSIFKTATIVCKFLHTGNDASFSNSSSFHTCSYDTRHGKLDNIFLNVPLFSSSVNTSKKQLSHSLYIWWTNNVEGCNMRDAPCSLHWLHSKASSKHVSFFKPSHPKFPEIVWHLCGYRLCGD